MPLKRLDTLKSCLLAIAAAVALPTAAYAATGGQAAPSTAADPAAQGPAAGAEGLAVPPGLLVHHVASLHGTLAGAGANAPVAIERLDAARGTWTTIAGARTAADGTFTAQWRADHIGRFTLRAVPGGAAVADAGQSSAPTAQLTVYRAATASWFGPGFYGKRTACGETMSPTLLGVAHRSLPCGTLVDVSYAGHSLTVPVVDRGPYRSGVSWDLTTATASALGLDQTARIGALALRGEIVAPTQTASTQTAPSGAKAGGAMAAASTR